MHRLNWLGPLRRRAAGQLALLALLLGGSVALAGAPGAQVAPQSYQWFDGGFQMINGLECITSTPQTYINTYTGYYGTSDTSSPRTGDISYIHAVIGVPGNPCAGGIAANIELLPPPGVVLAVSAQNRVRCYYTSGTSGQTSDVTNDSGANCVQSPGAGNNGGLNFGTRPVPSYGIFEMQIPVQYTRELKGIAGPSSEQLRFVIDTDWGDVAPSAWVIVPYRPQISYPSPVATLVTGTSAQLNATLYSFYKGGTAYFEYGTSTSYGQTTSSLTIPSSDIGYNVFADALNLAPGTAYHMRLRFVSSSGTYLGADQVFGTQGAPSPAPAPSSTPTSTPAIPTPGASPTPSSTPAPGTTPTPSGTSVPGASPTPSSTPATSPLQPRTYLPLVKS